MDSNIANANTKAARDLGYLELLVRIATRTQSEPGRQRILESTLEASVEAAQTRMSRSAEALALCERGEPLPQARLGDPEPIFERLARSGGLSIEQLAQVLTVCKEARALRRFIEPRRNESPLLYEVLSTHKGLDTLAETLDNAIDSDGTLSDRASPELKSARQSVNSLRGKVNRQLERLLARYADVLQGQYIAEREGRPVLPLRADAPYKVRGIVLGSSGSGGTVYLEPEEVTELNNQLQLGQAEVLRIEARVLEELSAKTRAELPHLREAALCLAQADALAAIAIWAKDTRAIPLLPGDGSACQLIQLRHPLLAEAAEGTTSSVVANDVTLRAGEVLIISGPNAGGKTVTLKALGLAAWMTQSGIPVCAEPMSEIGFYDRVLTDIGDEQSLERSLSTFTAHMDQVARALELASPRSLVLLDELAGSTDPVEGGALAVAILEFLVERGASVCVTTHYEQLKQLGAALPFNNAAVGFNRRTLRPTFELSLGLAGASAALPVAERYGIPHSVIARAEVLIPKELTLRAELIQELEDERSRLRHARTEAEEHARVAAALRGELELIRRSAREQEQARIRQEAQALTNEVQSARQKVAEVVRTLKSTQGLTHEARAAMQQLNEAANTLAIGGPVAEMLKRPEDIQTRAAAAPELTPGTEVYLTKLGKRATIVAAPLRGSVKVAIGPLKLSVNLSEVSLEAPRAPSKTGAKASPLSGGMRSKHDKVPAFLPSSAQTTDPSLRSSENTLDLRGQRVEESLLLLEQFIDTLLRNDESTGYVLHGHGTGALKTKVREFLKHSPNIARFYAAERDDGGDAFTVIHPR